MGRADRPADSTPHCPFAEEPLHSTAMSLAVDQLELGPIGTNTYLVRASATADEAVVVDPSGDAPTILRALDARRRHLHGNPRHPRPFRPHRQPRGSRRGFRRTRVRPVGRAAPARGAGRVHSARAHHSRGDGGRLARRWRGNRCCGDLVRRDGCSRSFACAHRVLRRPPPLLGRRALRRVGRPDRPARVATGTRSRHRSPRSSMRTRLRRSSIRATAPTRLSEQSCSRIRFSSVSVPPGPADERPDRAPEGHARRRSVGDAPLAARDSRGRASLLRSTAIARS